MSKIVVLKNAESGVFRVSAVVFRKFGKKIGKRNNLG